MVLPPLIVWLEMVKDEPLTVQIQLSKPSVITTLVIPAELFETVMLMVTGDPRNS